MRFILGFLSGVLGMLAGWFALALLVVSVAGPDHDGGAAMGAFFGIGPFGGLVGFGLGVWLFVSLGIVRGRAASTDAAVPAVQAPGARISRPFAAAVLALVVGLAWWGWYEFIRSPYLSHGYMTLSLHFELPAGSSLPPDVKDVQVGVLEDGRSMEVMFGPQWRAHAGDRPVIVASATLSMKTRDRSVVLKLPGSPAQIWQLDLWSDPDPTPDFSPWRGSDNGASAPAEMQFQLSADR